MQETKEDIIIEEPFKTTQLTKLGVTINELYEAKQQLIVTIKDSDIQFYVVLKDLNGKVDCKIRAVNKFLYCRTQHGRKMLMYNSLTALQNVVKMNIKGNIEPDKTIYFSLSDNVRFY